MDESADAASATATPPARTEADAEAFYRAEHPRLWAYLTRACRDRAMAEEIAQESFVRLLASRGATLAPEARRGYLYRIAENLRIDLARRRTRERAAPVDEAEAIAAPDADRADAPRSASRTTAAAFAALDERDRRLVWLAHVEEWSHAEIGRLLGYATASVKVALHRARRRLAERIEEENRK